MPGMPQLDKSAHLPLPGVTEVDRLPRWVLGDDATRPALVPAGVLDMRLLDRFRASMARCGEDVLVHRMRYDRRYAFDRIVIAHNSIDRHLRRLAAQLFDEYVGPPRR